MRNATIHARQHQHGRRAFQGNPALERGAYSEPTFQAPGRASALGVEDHLDHLENTGRPFISRRTFIAILATAVLWLLVIVGHMILGGFWTIQ